MKDKNTHIAKIETLAKGFYCVKLPLPNTPLKSLNVTIIKGEDRNLIVDTGLNHDDCFEAMEGYLNELDIDLNKTDFFITHLHADHFGLLHRLVKEGSKVYFNQPESEILAAWEGWDANVESARVNGFPAEKLRAALESHPGFKHGADWHHEITLVHDNDIITVGDYQLQCISTPGHTLGHTCLYEPENKIFISADHILGDITPNIQGWEHNEYALADYFNSLDKVYPLDVDIVIPGHRSLIKDFKARITTLKEHHFERLEEIESILSECDCDAYETASKMHWDIRAKSWEDFPIAQKWFATGEALAHLHYLEQNNKIKSELVNHIHVYSKI